MFEKNLLFYLIAKSVKNACINMWKLATKQHRKLQISFPGNTNYLQTCKFFVLLLIHSK